MKKVIYLFIVIASCLFFSCNKDKSEQPAIISWTGEVAVDGCDWIITVDGISYHPENLSSEFKQDGLNVLIYYKKKNGKFSCGLNPAGKSIIEIISIKKK